MNRLTILTALTLAACTPGHVDCWRPEPCDPATEVCTCDAGREGVRAPTVSPRPRPYRATAENEPPLGSPGRPRWEASWHAQGYE